MKRCTRPKILLAIGTSAAITLTSGFSQVTSYFPGGNGTSSWIKPGNWDPEVPTASSNVEIDNNPDAGLLNVDTGVPTTIASFAVLSGSVTADFTIAGQALTVTGNLTNDTEHTVSIDTRFSAGPNATWSGVFQFGGAETKIGTNTITLGSGIGFASTGNLTVDIGTGTLQYGKFVGLGLTMASGSKVNIAITGAYTGVGGDVFDFLEVGGFGPATLDLSGAPLSGGLTWDESLFATEGKLSVVPEPSTWALVGLALVTSLLIPRRSRALAVVKKRV